MQVTLINKTIPNETRYVIELGESQLKTVYACLYRGRLTVDNPDRLSYEILEKQIKEILNASSVD
jgi:hypothetical protein